MKKKILVEGKTFLNDTTLPVQLEIKTESITLPLVFCFQIEQVTYTDPQRWMPYKPGKNLVSILINQELEFANNY